MKHGFDILDRNYTKKWGEIDIVAEKDGKLYFIEVKSVAHLPAEAEAKEGETRPEDNMHPWKLKRLSRIIQTYLLSKRHDEPEWQVDLLVFFKSSG